MIIVKNNRSGGRGVLMWQLLITDGYSFIIKTMSNYDQLVNIHVPKGSTVEFKYTLKFM